jgi:Fur family ferric uptake transcriptional regulator
LDLLIECDLVTKHQFGTNQSLFEKSYGFRQHDHLICLVCNKVMEFCDPRVSEIQEMIGSILNFEVKHHSLVLYGNCKNPTCENAKQKEN